MSCACGREDGCPRQREEQRTGARLSRARTRDRRPRVAGMKGEGGAEAGDRHATTSVSGFTLRDKGKLRKLGPGGPPGNRPPRWSLHGRLIVP